MTSPPLTSPPPVPGPFPAPAVVRPSRRSRWADVAFAAGALALVGALHVFFVRVPHDADSAYHAAVGELIRQHGILRAFPWTPMSWLADHYADKELLFHLFYAALSGFGWLVASRVVGTVCGAALLVALYAVLRAERVRLAALWAVLPLLVSSVFLFRFALVRPHLLSIALAIVVLWAASRRRLLVLALASLVYPWAYVAWILPLVLVGAAEVARVASGERPSWKPAAVALAGLGVGLALHPNAANLVRLASLVIGEILVVNAWGGRRGLELGTEFDPFPASQWISLLLLAVAVLVAALVLAWRHRRTSSTPLAFALAALAFGLATVRTARFAEYFVPLSVAALALALRHAGSPRLRLAPVALALLALLYQGREEASLLAGLREWPDRIPAYVAKVMQQAIPPGAQVFTCEWGLTGYLMRALPERRFLVALDPSLFRAKDPELYALWYAMTRRPPPEVARLVRERFGARYVVCFYDPQFEAFTERLSREPGVRTVLVSDDWNVYDLGNAAP